MEHSWERFGIPDKIRHDYNRGRPSNHPILAGTFWTCSRCSCKCYTPADHEGGPDSKTLFIFQVEPDCDVAAVQKVLSS